MASLVATKCERVLTGVVSNTTWLAPQSRVVPVSGTFLLSWPGAVCLPLSEAPNGRLGLRSRPVFDETGADARHCIATRRIQYAGHRRVSLASRHPSLRS